MQQIDSKAKKISKKVGFYAPRADWAYGREGEGSHTGQCADMEFR